MDRKVHTTSSLAQATGKCMSTIRRIAKQIPGGEKPSGTFWVYPESAVQWVLNRPETRGRKPKHFRNRGDS